MNVVVLGTVGSDVKTGEVAVGVDGVKAVVDVTLEGQPEKSGPSAGEMPSEQQPNGE